jgi:RNA polymerase sigma-70 factor, ECF subfamily
VISPASQGPGRDDGEVQLEAAYRRYFPMILEKCRRMLGDVQSAEDVAQETFIRFWKASASGDEPQVALAWIYRTSTRLAIDRMRQVRSQSQAAGARALAWEEAHAPLDSAVELRQTLAALAQQVPKDELEVALLSRIDRLTHPELAEVAGVSERTVRRLLARFEVRLQQLKERRE